MRIPVVVREYRDSFIDGLSRLKTVDTAHMSDTPLARVLTTLDLTALGVGSTLGAGIYVVAGQVALQHSGPSVVLSFFIAAVASILAGLCYAEFGARVPKTGSAYVYTYVTVGEFLAFVIGWNLILEYAIGTASVASAWSSYVDSLVGKKISGAFNSTMHMDIAFLGDYPDFFAFGITLLLTVILSVGVKESTSVNNIFTGLNLLIVIYSVICGAFKADPANWSLPPHEDPATHITDSGGFVPFGVSEMIAGASTCFYAFVGFDAIATTGEEAKNPQKAIPISIITSLLICCAAYCSVSIIITLMVPYYSLDSTAPLPLAFKAVGYPVAQWVISIGAIFGLSTSLLGAMFPLPRILYAMASDGIIPRFLATVSERFKTPLIATVISGIFAGFMACVFALTELVDMMSIGTLMAYTLVACSVLLLRYKVDPEDTELVEGEVHGIDSYQGQDCIGRQITRPTLRTQKIVAISILIMCGFALVAGLGILLLGLEDTQHHLIFGPQPAKAFYAMIGVGLIGATACVGVIYSQPQSRRSVTFKVPFLPIVGSVSAVVNIILMLKLSSATWIRFGVWMAVGFVVYFGYGIMHSSERKKSYQGLVDENSLLVEPGNSDFVEPRTYDIQSAEEARR